MLLSASRVPSADEVRRVFTRANEILFQKTGERMSQVDHYGTAQCTSRTGMSVADAQNLVLFQQSCGMCPDLCSQFRHR